MVHLWVAAAVWVVVSPGCHDQPSTVRGYRNRILYVVPICVTLTYTVCLVNKLCRFL
jgi:hypothetical protein